MKNIIMGTAGHVDHGKTQLIKALSGTDTDRLAEEKKRGITIELGFARIPNDAGYNIGVVDVPGHEKFIKNMLAGIGGIDFVLFVVAADEGIMPQTREHFEILKAMGIDDGIIAVTKKDMVDDDWLEMVEEELRDYFKGSFLDGQPMIAVSSKTGENIDLLKKEIIKKCDREVKRNEDPRAFRLPVDRVFTMSGFGTVVTGTLVDGVCRLGEDVVIYPEGIKTTVRGIQNHNRAEEEAVAGQRTAINLRDVSKDDIKRGDVVAAENAVVVTSMIDAKLKIFDSSERIVQNNSRVHLYTGANETIAKVIILNRDAMVAGDEAYVQFRLESPVAVKRSDRFIIRFYSPIETIGGGIMLDVFPPKHKRNREDVLRGLELMENGSLADMIEVKASRGYNTVGQIAAELGVFPEKVEAAVKDDVDSGRVSLLKDGTVMTKNRTDRMQQGLENVVTAYHKENPLSAGIPKQELLSRLADTWHLDDPKFIQVMTSFYIDKGVIADKGKSFAMAGFKPEYTEGQLKLRDEVADRYDNAGIEMPSNAEIHEMGDDKVIDAILADLASEGRIVKLSPSYYISSGAWQKAVDTARSFSEGQFSLADFRDAVGTSRKYAAEILAAMDKFGITVRNGDIRTLV